MKKMKQFFKLLSIVIIRDIVKGTNSFSKLVFYTGERKIHLKKSFVCSKHKSIGAGQREMGVSLKDSQWAKLGQRQHQNKLYYHP